MIVGDQKPVPQPADNFDVMVAEATWRNKPTFKKRVQQIFAS